MAAPEQLNCTFRTISADGVRRRTYLQRQPSSGRIALLWTHARVGERLPRVHMHVVGRRASACNFRADAVERACASWFETSPGSVLIRWTDQTRPAWHHPGNKETNSNSSRGLGCGGGIERYLHDVELAIIQQHGEGGLSTLV